MTETTETPVARSPLGAVTLSGGVATLTLAQDGGVNRINPDFIAGFEALVSALSGVDGLRGVILRSAHADFCVGADLEFVHGETDPSRIFEATTRLGAAFRALETLGVPVVALLHGAALGGGYELALACHHRLALASPRVKVGLPEVSLGVIPGGGGTQRLPRLIGIQPALEVIGAGLQLRADKALARGLVDGVHPDVASMEAAAEAFIAAHPRCQQPWDRPGFSFPDVQPGTPDFRNLGMGAQAMLYKKTAGAFGAPLAALMVITEGAGLRFDRAVELEGRAFSRLVVSGQAKDMIRTLFFHKQAADKHKGLPALERGASAGIAKVAILGAGMMGAGLAFLCAKAGYAVVLKDIRQSALDAGMRHIDGQIARLKHLGEAERAAIAARVTGTLELEPLRGTDLVIEAVIEDKRVKHAVLKETQGLLTPGTAIWASNTSALPIAELAEPAEAPDRFLGLHFFSPVEKMPLIEIIRSPATSDETLARCLDFARRIRKTPIVVGDRYGFYTSLVFSAYILEGVQLLAEGTDPRRLEWAARTTGMMVPPLQVFDEVTLTLGRHVLDQAEAYTGRVLHGARDLLIAMVDTHDRRGKVHGGGFYDYQEGRRRGLWPGLAPLVAELGGDPATATQDGEAIGRRLLLAQALEAARAVDDGTIARPRDADVGGVFGVGFAPNTGGPLSWIDRQGLPEIVAELDAMAERLGPRWACPQVLRDMAARGERFYGA